MAVFGLTELHEDDALRAVRTAVEMRETLTRLNEDLEQRYGFVLATRTGVNTGAVAGEGLAPPRLEAPLVGRQDTLAQLEWALERTVTGKGCRLVSVFGAPGIGKSRLAHEFVARLGERATVLQGRCLPYGDGITFWPAPSAAQETLI